MAYDENLAVRMRVALEGSAGLVEKKLFGGQGFTINGNMAASVYHDGRLMIRCAKADHETLLAEPGASPKLSGTKPMAGWVLVESSVVVNDNVLLESVVRGRDYAASLPPKDKKASPSRQ